MKATFTVADERPSEFPSPSFDIDVCFNGIPGTVILEVAKNGRVGYSGESDNPITTVQKERSVVMRTALKASEARALASAILSAATEARN